MFSHLSSVRSLPPSHVFIQSSRAPTLVHGFTRWVEHTIPNGEGLADMIDGFLSYKHLL